MLEGLFVSYLLDCTCLGSLGCLTTSITLSALGLTVQGINAESGNTKGGSHGQTLADRMNPEPSFQL